MSISRRTIDAVSERASLAEIAGETLKLKRTGSQFMSCCPFHEDRTPSFSINDEKGLFNCFGCGKKGNIFDFVQETRGFSFPEAVRFLAGRYGVTVEEDGGESEELRKARAGKTKALREVILAASDVYQRILVKEPLGEPARQYLNKRGISRETALAFRLGFAPDSWDFITAQILERLKEKELNRLVADEDNLAKLMLEAGLIRSKTQRGVSAGNVSGEGEPDVGAKPGKFYDFFRSRLIFPIARSDGAPIAFGGRLIEPDAKAPKYLNSSESLIYSKRRTFYGMFQGLTAIRKAKHAFLVEGYMDVLGLYQRGFAELLATCGTALTNDHARILSRLVDRVTVIFDGDLAGIKAAANSFEMFLNTGVDVSVVIPPAGEDPDSLARNSTAEALRTQFDSLRRPAVDVYLEYLTSEHVEPGAELTPAVCGKIATRFSSILLRVKNPVEVEFLSRRASERLGVSVESISKLVADLRHQDTGGMQQSFVPQSSRRVAPELEPPADRFPPVGFSAADSFQLTDQGGYSGPSRSGSDSNRSRVTGGRKGRRSLVRTPEETLQSYFSQIIVSILCEPRLAASLLELPSLVEGVDGGSPLPENVREFVGVIAKSSFTGFKIPDRNKRGPASENDEKVPPEEIEWVRGELERCGLDAGELLAEALRQSQIGGSEPGKLVGEADNIARRQSLISQVSRIRKEESQAGDDSQLEGLIQEKLMRRRNLEQLKRSGDKR